MPKRSLRINFVDCNNPYSLLFSSLFSWEGVLEKISEVSFVLLEEVIFNRCRKTRFSGTF
jgi:hypothetical protein